MKKILLFAGLLCSAAVFSQTTIFSDDFESGSTNWTLNGGTGGNVWIVNNLYTGYSPLIADTPGQPSGVSGSPQSSYLHIHNTSACTSLSVCNASFDTGSTSDQNATMTTPIVATGMNTITLSFYYLCAGATGVSYGTLQYSLDNGASWTDARIYSGVTTWTQESVSLPAWDNQTSLTFRFNWKNGATGVDPAFAVDEVKVTAISAASETITGVLPDITTGWCYNDVSIFNLEFTSAGTYTSGNVFTAELSDASGDFTTPTAIGTLTSTTSGSLTIPCTVPAGTAVGNGYRVRVTSSNPAVISAANNTDLIIYALPTVDAGEDQTVCIGQMVTLSGSGAVAYSWDNGITDNVSFTPTLGTTVYTVTGTSADGCINTDQVSVTSEVCVGLEDNVDAAHISVFPNPTNDQFTIEGTTQISSIRVIDLGGRTMMTLKPTPSNVYSINGLTAGTYFVVISDGKSEFSTRIVKQ